MNQAISLLIIIEVKPGHREEQIKAYNELAPKVLAEEGCLEYNLQTVEGDENKFVLVEKWKSEEALAFHDDTDYMKEADSKNHLFRAKPAEVLRLADI